MAEAAPEPALTLDAHYYTDPDHHKREHEAILLRTWQYAGHASQAEDPGDYFTFEIAGESLFCVRGDDGELRAFYNVCQHRAHPVVEGCGSAKRALVCPYHGWAYRLDGRLMTKPKIQGMDPGSIRLSAVRTEVWGGFIFVNLNPEAKPMSHWYPGVERELREYVPDLDELKPLEWVEIPERCNWKVSIENHSECYHCALNHTAFGSGIVQLKSYDIQPDASGHCLRHSTQCQNLEKLFYPVDLDSHPHAGDYRTWLLWPLFAFQVYPGNLLNTYHWRPHGVGGVTVWRGWFTPGGVESETVRKLATLDRETTVEEDIHLVEAVQRGLGSRGYRAGPLVLDPKCGPESEHSVRALHQWVRDALGD